MITVKDVSKSFGSHVALDGVNFEVGAGDIVGLAGPSGSGKSTLLRCIQGLESPDSGSISCRGRSGFMFQDFQLFPHMTVWENILYAPKLRRLLFNSRLEIMADKLLHQLGIEQFKDRYPASLSGGQKQRVAMARTLILGPDVLLFDEPTSGLDIATTGDVVAMLKSVHNSKTVIIIASHDLDFLTQICDRIFLIKNGAIMKSVEPQKLVNPIAHLKKFYD